MARYEIKRGNINTDEVEICAVLHRNLSECIDERYSWNYRKVPFEFTRCWLAMHQERCVGTVALFPRKFFMNGRSGLAAVMGDFAVDKEHRVFGPAPALQKAIQNEYKDSGAMFVYSIPNELSKKLVVKLGYEKIGEINRYTKILSAAHVTKKLGHSHLPVRTFSNLVNLGLKLFSKESWLRPTLKYKMELPESFDERVDVLCQKVGNDFGVIGHRSSSFLNWRFMQSPDADYKIFLITDEHKQVLGYVVFSICENECRIADMLFWDSASILDTLLAAFIRYLKGRKIGSVSINYLGNRLLPRRLRSFNFFLRKDDAASLLIFSSDPSLKPALLNSDNWYFLAGDNDI